MGKTKSNIPKSKRGGYDLWGNRPLSGFVPVSSYSKRRCRKIERSRAKSSTLEELNIYWSLGDIREAWDKNHDTFATLEKAILEQ